MKMLTKQPSLFLYESFGKGKLAKGKLGKLGFQISVS